MSKSPVQKLSKDVQLGKKFNVKTYRAAAQLSGTPAGTAVQDEGTYEKIIDSYRPRGN